MKFLAPIFFSLLSSFLLSSCSTPQSRAEEKSAEFRSLPQSTQEIALKGEVAKGMSQNAVYVALGNPDRIEKTDNPKQEKWIYTEARTRQIPEWNDIQQVTSQGNVVSYRTYHPIEFSQIKDSFEITFENGKVVAWRHLS
jgi:outer membrane protein assembly factor BamE (lipoprotein component of BamABCDE complex)